VYSGLLANLSLRWFDARELIMGGGILAGLGMFVMSISPQYSLLFLAAVVAGLYQITF